MGDVIVAASALFALAVVLWTLAHRGDPGPRRPPSRDAEIISIQPIDGAPGMYHYEFNPRRFPRAGGILPRQEPSFTTEREIRPTANRGPKPPIKNLHVRWSRFV